MKRSGFSLVELLVVLALIALLLSFLIPILATVRDRARTTACLSNLRQIGQAIHMYAVDHKDLILPADLRDPNFDNPGGRWGNWATVLVMYKYLSAPDQTQNPHPTQTSVLRCPEGTERNGFDTDAYNVDRFSELQAGYWRRQAADIQVNGTLLPTRTIYTWYGVNGDMVGDAYPMFRWPGDNYRTKLHSFSEIKGASSMAMVYDGFFHHDGEQNLMGNARHKKRTVTNYLFADGHVEGVVTASLPASFDDADLEARPFPRFKLKQR